MKSINIRKGDCHFGDRHSNRNRMPVPKVTVTLLVMTALLPLLLTSCNLRATSTDIVKYIPIQHSGQVKSFDSFARETISLIAGQEKWQGQSPSQLLFEAIYHREKIGELKWVKIDFKELILFLNLSSDRNYFSYNEVLPSADKLEALVRGSQAKRDQDIRPSMLEQKAEALFSKLMDVKHLITGESIKVIPPSEGDAWISPFEMDTPLSGTFKQLIVLAIEEKIVDFNLKTYEWINEVDKLTHQKYRQKVELEVRYHDLKPFQWAWMLYLVAFLCLSILKENKWIRRGGIAALVTAVLFHTLGLTLRVLILGRPPVSNMYESMIYMNWIVIVTASIFSVLRKNSVIASIGALVSAIIMIYGNLLPIDPSLEVLVPVLRSNYWLTIHVLTIVSSYGVLALAMGLGHRHLILEMRGKLSKKEEEKSAQEIYRVIQMGMLLLGIGTVLGGVWANESWGRFWGWDPKETWALITFLGYAIVIHLKFAQILDAFGLALSSVLGFLLVLMTWYGVNFVLGRGLHSYGQGSGGIVWVAYYLILEIVFISWVLLKRLFLQ